MHLSKPSCSKSRDGGQHRAPPAAAGPRGRYLCCRCVPGRSAAATAWLETADPVDQIVFECRDHAAAIKGFRNSRAPLSLVVRWPLSSTRTAPLQVGVQVDMLSPMASGPLSIVFLAKHIDSTRENHSPFLFSGRPHE